tara:strand:+ start:130 stop:426 length:297 start_codon:yes stop_codon:yes gene_type:complete
MKLFGIQIGKTLEQKIEAVKIEIKLISKDIERIKEENKAIDKTLTSGGAYGLKDTHSYNRNLIADLTGKKNRLQIKLDYLKTKRAAKIRKEDSKGTLK